MAETLTDVIAIFGDLRILDMYSRDASRVSRITTTVPMVGENTLDAEKGSGDLHADRDKAILAGDCSERVQEEIGSRRALEPLEAFDSNSAEAMEKFEKEWAVEARWIYSVLAFRHVNAERSREDYTLWSPCQMDDAEDKYTPPTEEHSAIGMIEHKRECVTRIHVLLRDLKGRGFDPHYIWASMSRAKYAWYLNLEDLIAVSQLDSSEWENVWAKLGRSSEKLLRMQSQIEQFLDERGESDPPRIALADSLRVELTNLQSELAFLTSSEGLQSDLSEVLDDFSLSLSTEMEPVCKYILEDGPVAQRRSSAIHSVISLGLHESLIPLLTLSPREIGDNLQIGARIHKGPFAGGLQSPQFPEGNLEAGRSSLVDFLSSTIASNVKVRAWFRRDLSQRATISTHPLTAVTANMRMYTVRRVCMRPVSELLGTEIYLAIHALASQGELKVDLVVSSDDGRIVAEGERESFFPALKKLLEKGSTRREEDALVGDETSLVEEMLVRNVALLKESRQHSGGHGVELVSEDPLLRDLLHHMRPEVRDTVWLSDVRVAVARAAVQKLYKSIKSELLRELLRDNMRVAARSAGRALTKLISMQPFNTRVGTVTKIAAGMADSELVSAIQDQRVLREVVRRKLGSAASFTVLGTVVEKLANGVRVHAVVVNEKGVLVDSVQLDHFLMRWSDKQHVDKATVQGLIKRHLPALMVVGAEDRKSRSLFAELKKTADWVYHNGYEETEASKFLEPPTVCFGDMGVAGRAAGPIAKAISLARFQQSPIAETLQLCTEGAPKVSLHPLQGFIPIPSLRQQLVASATAAVAEIGVDLNDAATAESRAVLLSFVPGLGPRKARVLLEKTDATLKGVLARGQETSRADRLEALLGKRVARNAQPFLKLVADVDRVVRAMSGPNDDSSDSDSSDSSSDDDEGSQEAPPAASSNEWTKDAEGNWVKADVVPPSTGEWTKDASGNWVKVDVPAPAASSEEWSKDAEGNWVKADVVPPSTSSEEWTKDASGNWVKAAAGADAWGNNDHQGGWSSWAAPAAPQYFGVSSKTVESVLHGFSFFEQCRLAKECWPVAREVGAKDLWAAVGTNPDTSTDLSALLEAMFAARLPPHLADPEIDPASFKTEVLRLITQTLILPQLHTPFASTRTYEWKQATRQQVFYACIAEAESDFNKWTIVNCTVANDSTRTWVNLTELTTGLQGELTKGYQDRSQYWGGDSVRCRISGIDFGKFTLAFSTEPISDSEMVWFWKGQKFFVSRPSDFENLRFGLGKVEPVASHDVSRTQLKTRRIIKHDSYLEISHSAAVARLAEAAIGEVIFRPSSSHPGQYLGMIKIKPLTDSVDPGKEDWIKIVRFTESPSTRIHGKAEAVFRMLDTNEEFEEFDQMKVLYVQRYLRNLHELMAHPKFRPETIDRVTNLVKAKSMASQKGEVVYWFVLDTRREFAGNAILLWAASSDKVHQDPIEISNRGFKWWTKGPYPTLTALLNWWKMGGYKERPALIEEWKSVYMKKQE